jgi:hypothetical protein
MQEIPSDIEVNGESLGATVDAFRQYPSIVSKYLLQYEVVEKSAKPLNIDRNAWYPLDKWLAAYAAIAKEVGLNSLYTIGKKIPENAAFPAHISDIYVALGSIDIAYHMNHRKAGVVMFDPQTGMMLEGIGHYAYRLEEEQRAVLVCENPYPCEFDRGIITAMATRFAPTSRTVHDNDAPCRKKGGSSCTYIVWW